MIKKKTLLQKQMINNKSLFLTRYRRKTNVSLKKLDDFNLNSEEEADLMSSLIMMYKETKNLIINEFLEYEDFVFIFYLMEYSVDAMMNKLNYIQFKDSKWIYLIYAETLEELISYAEKLELYEISSNIKKWLDFFIKKTFDFNQRKFILNGIKK